MLRNSTRKELIYINFGISMNSYVIFLFFVFLFVGWLFVFLFRIGRFVIIVFVGFAVIFVGGHGRGQDQHNQGDLFWKNFPLNFEFFWVENGDDVPS